jgi:hypothetical protein
MMSLASSPSPTLPKVAAETEQPLWLLGAARVIRAQMHALKGQQPWIRGTAPRYPGTPGQAKATIRAPSPLAVRNPPGERPYSSIEMAC